MDSNKLAYFVAKYRTASEDEFGDVRDRRGSLAEEAEAAFAQVAQERGIALEAAAATTGGAVSSELSPEERSRQTQLSTELWRSPLSMRVKYQYAILFAMPVLHVAGAQGMRLGALLLVAAAAPAWYLGQRVGHRYTKSVCANGDKPIDQKRRQLRTTSWLLWPAIVAATLVAAALLRVGRGV